MAGAPAQNTQDLEARRRAGAAGDAGEAKAVWRERCDAQDALVAAAKASDRAIQVWRSLWIVHDPIRCPLSHGPCTQQHHGRQGQ